MKIPNVNKFLNCIFIISCGIFLAIPVLGFGHSNVVKKEARTMTKFNNFWPGDESVSFSENFENWLSDRLFLKSEIISLCKSIKYLLSYNLYADGKFIIDKKNKLIYTNSFFANRKLNEDILLQIVDNLRQLNSYCMAKNINLYILLAPRRADYLLFNTFKQSDRIDYISGYIGYIKDKTHLNIIYPKLEFEKENLINPVYYKTDHHWTHSGAYVAYKVLMNDIKKDFPEVKILDKEQFNTEYSKRVKTSLYSKYGSGALLRTTGISEIFAKDFLDTDYLYYIHPDKPQIANLRKYDIVNFNKTTDLYFYYSKGGNNKVMIVGDSYREALLEFLPYSFRQTLSFSANDRKLVFAEYKDTIETFKPDILIIVFRCSNLTLLSKIFPLL